MPYTPKELTELVRAAVREELDRYDARAKRRDERVRELIKRKYQATDDDLDAIFAELDDAEA